MPIDDILPDVITSFYIANKRFYGSGRILQACPGRYYGEIDSLIDMETGEELLDDLGSWPDILNNSPFFDASHAGASYSMEVACKAFIAMLGLDREPDGTKPSVDSTAPEKSNDITLPSAPRRSELQGLRQRLSPSQPKKRSETPSSDGRSSHAANKGVA